MEDFVMSYFQNTQINPRLKPQTVVSTDLRSQIEQDCNINVHDTKLKTHETQTGHVTLTSHVTQTGCMTVVIR